MKLIVFPLGCLILLSLLSMTGLGSTILGDASMSLDTATAKYYDYYGAEKCWVANLTAVDPAETYFKLWNSNGDAVFTNDSIGYLTGTGVYYTLWYDASHSFIVDYVDLGKTYMQGLGDNDIGSSIGLIALIIGLMALAAIVGIRILGSGTSETSVGTIILGTSYLAIWAVFSVLALELILAGGDLLLPIMYFVLTAIYTVGIVMQIGGTGND